MQESVSTNDTPKRKTRRSYTKAFKSRIVAQCNNGEKSIARKRPIATWYASDYHRLARRVNSTDNSFH